MGGPRTWTLAYATSQSTDVSCSWARAPPGNARSPSRTEPMTATITIDSGLIDSPPSLPSKGSVELLRVLEPLQHKVAGREARKHPRGGPDDGVDVRVVPDVWIDGLDHGGEDHRVQAPAGLTKCLIVFS